MRAMLLLIYGAGLRISEALHLTCPDVDLSAMTLTIRESKFYKTRRIALNAQLCGVLSEYDHNRRQKEHARSDAALFFTYKDGGAVARYVLEDAFLRLRTHVGVKRQNARYQPRLHDLRHTFAVHRLTAWYRTGADVQSLLPGLSTHLGHLCLKGTQRYLTMTPELLTEASLPLRGLRAGGASWISASWAHGCAGSFLIILFMSGIYRTTLNKATGTHLPCCFRSWLNERKRHWTVYR